MARNHALAGTPTHSAISSDLPSSDTHSSLQMYIARPPQQAARLPRRTGFHRAWRTGRECKRTLRKAGVNGSPGSGKENRCIAFDTFSVIKRSRAAKSVTHQQPTVEINQVAHRIGRAEQTLSD